MQHKQGFLSFQKGKNIKRTIMFGFRIKIFTADLLISIYLLNMYYLYMHEHGPICIIKWVI